MTHVLAVDGNSLAHRAYHALVRERLGGAWVTHGVVRMLATAWEEGPYDAVVVAFDGADNRRRELYPAYKAHREEKDPELVEQLERLVGHLARCGFTVHQEAGVEADDWLAAVADDCVARGWRCDVLSSDRDLVALVCDEVRMLRPRSSMADLGVYTPAVVEREFGVRPDQYTDYAALRGDPSDGLDGAKGIGPKTAARLLRDHGDLATIYRELSNLPHRTEELLRAGREAVDRNLLLMAPIPNLVPDLDGAAARGVDIDRLREVLHELGLRAAARSFTAAVEAPPRPPLPPPPVDAPPAGTTIEDATTSGGDTIVVPDEDLVPVRAAPPPADGVQDALF